MDGFQGSPNGNSIHIHLMPLVEATWYMSLVQRGVQDNKTLDEIFDLIMEESDARNLLHARKMELLRVKKTGSHSDYLFQLEQIGELIDFKSLSLDSFIMHLFLEEADCEMAKLLLTTGRRAGFIEIRNQEN